MGEDPLVFSYSEKRNKVDHHPLLIGNVKLEKKDPPSLSAHDDFIIMHIFVCYSKDQEETIICCSILITFFSYA